MPTDSTGRKIPPPPMHTTHRVTPTTCTPREGRTWTPMQENPERYIVVRNLAPCAADGSKPELTERGKANAAKVRALRERAAQEGRLVR